MKLYHNPRSITDASPRLLDVLEEFKKLIEGNPYSEFEDIEVTFGSANTELRINLAKLNRTPVVYVPVKKDRACDIYDGGTAWTRNVIYLKSTVASAVVKLRVN